MVSAARSQQVLGLCFASGLEPWQDPTQRPRADSTPGKGSCPCAWYQHLTLYLHQLLREHTGGREVHCDNTVAPQGHLYPREAPRNTLEGKLFITWLVFVMSPSNRAAWVASVVANGKGFCLVSVRTV